MVEFGAYDRTVLGSVSTLYDSQVAGVHVNLSSRHVCLAALSNISF